jgi:NTP pyrophosphatase (non-canonical NTP hydrolase)
LCGEAGEAANVVKKIRRYECGIKEADKATEAMLIDHLGNELADVIVYADLLATKYGIDLPRKIIEKFNAVSEREGFPQRLEVR